MSESPQSTLRADVSAGLVVALVALPLCLGIALASGAPLMSGLLAGIVGGIVVGALSGSHLSVTGPAAGLTSIVLIAIAKVGSFDAFLTAVVLAGVIQVALGALKMGGLVNYFPSSVIKGMLAGIGIIIILKQIPHAVGYDKVPEGEDRFFQTDAENSFSELIHLGNSISPGAILIAIVGIAILLGWDRVMPKRLKAIPSALVAVLAGVGINALLLRFAPGLAMVEDEHLVRVPITESLAAMFSSLSHPSWAAIGRAEVWITALTIAIVASIETLLCLEAVDRLDPQKRHSPANRELFAQGAGNIVSGLIGGLPITSVIVRSSANVNAGAQTKLSAIFHGVLLLLCVASIPQLLNKIPLASLAAILLITGWRLAKPSNFKAMYQQGVLQFLPFVATILCMVFTDLLKGVALGLAFSIFFILRENMRRSFIQEDEGGVPHLRMAPHVTFLHKASLLKSIQSLQGAKHLVIDGTHSHFIDPDVVDSLRDFQATKAAELGLKLDLVGPVFDGPARSIGH